MLEFFHIHTQRFTILTYKHYTVIILYLIYANSKYSRKKTVIG